MIAFGDIYEDENFDEEYAKLELIRSYLHCYQDDWKIDYDSLNHFISEALEQTFEITFEEAQHEFARIKNKVETESDYTLLYVDYGFRQFLLLSLPKISRNPHNRNCGHIKFTYQPLNFMDRKQHDRNKKRSFLANFDKTL